MTSEQVLRCDNKRDCTSEKDEELELIFVSSSQVACTLHSVFSPARKTTCADAYYKLCQIPNGFGTDKMKHISNALHHQNTQAKGMDLRGSPCSAYGMSEESTPFLQNAYMGSYTQMDSGPVYSMKAEMGGHQQSQQRPRPSASFTTSKVGVTANKKTTTQWMSTTDSVSGISII